MAITIGSAVHGELIYANSQVYHDSFLPMIIKDTRGSIVKT